MLLWWSFTVITFSVPYQPTHCLELCFMPITQYIHSFWAEYFWEAHEDELSENVILETQKHGIKCNKPKHIISIQRKVHIISLLISWLFGLNWSFSNFKVESVPRHFLPWVFPLGASYKNKSNTYFEYQAFKYGVEKKEKEKLVKIPLSTLHYQLDQHSSQPLHLSIPSSVEWLNQRWKNNISPSSKHHTFPEWFYHTIYQYDNFNSAV